MNSLNPLTWYSLECARIRHEKGFHTPRKITPDIQDAVLSNGDIMLGKLMLVVTEVSEAAEAVRHNDLENFVEELADIFIRLFDICGTMSIDIDKAIKAKLEVNKDRPPLHNKETVL